VGISAEVGVLTLMVCRATAFIVLPRRLLPLMLNTVASSKLRSRAHSRVSFSLKLVLRRDGRLLLVKTILKFWCRDFIYISDDEFFHSDFVDIIEVVPNCDLLGKT